MFNCVMKHVSCDRQEVAQMATLKDVAKEAGLSVGTVSRVLNNRGYISDETRESVYTAMKKLDYQPNEMARSLSKQKTNTIGLIMPSIEHPYFARLISCLERAAYEKGYKILLFCAYGIDDQEKKFVEACKSNRVAGLIICSDSVRTQTFNNLGFPLVSYERFLDSSDAVVACDNEEGGRLAAEELIGRGCRKVACMCGSSRVGLPADIRKDEFLAVCREKGVQAEVSYFDPERMNDFQYYPQIVEFLKTHPDVDGIFCGSDVIAAEAIQAADDLQIDVPGRLKIVGYDDVFPATLTSPRITTLHQPVKEMAETCIELIIKKNNGDYVPSKSIFHVSLVRRGTT